LGKHATERRGSWDERVEVLDVVHDLVESSDGALSGGSSTSDSPIIGVEVGSVGETGPDLRRKKEKSERRRLERKRLKSRLTMGVRPIALQTARTRSSISPSVESNRKESAFSEVEGRRTGRGRTRRSHGLWEIRASEVSKS